MIHGITAPLFCHEWAKGECRSKYKTGDNLCPNEMMFPSGCPCMSLDSSVWPKICYPFDIDAEVTGTKLRARLFYVGTKPELKVAANDLLEMIAENYHNRICDDYEADVTGKVIDLHAGTEYNVSGYLIAETPETEFTVKVIDLVPAEPDLHDYAGEHPDQIQLEEFISQGGSLENHHV